MSKCGCAKEESGKKPCSCKLTGFQAIGGDTMFARRGENRFALDRASKAQGLVGRAPETFDLAGLGTRFGQIGGDFAGMSIAPYSHVSACWVVAGNGQRFWLDALNPIRFGVDGPITILPVDGGHDALAALAVSTGLARPWAEPAISVVGHYDRDSIPFPANRQSTILTKLHTPTDGLRDGNDLFLVDMRGRSRLNWSFQCATVTSGNVQVYGCKTGGQGGYLLSEVAYTSAVNGLVTPLAWDGSYPVAAICWGLGIGANMFTEVEAI